MPKWFYATMQRGDRTAWLAGPFLDHGAALAIVPAVREAAQAVDPRAVFDAFGTSSVDQEARPRPGVLNAHLKLERPHAAAGLKSYRYRGPFGPILIGAADDAQALREAARSLERGAVDPRMLDVFSYASHAYQPVESPQ